MVEALSEQTTSDDASTAGRPAIMLLALVGSAPSFGPFIREYRRDAFP